MTESFVRVKIVKTQLFVTKGENVKPLIIPIMWPLLTVTVREEQG